MQAPKFSMPTCAALIGLLLNSCASLPSKEVRSKEAGDQSRPAIAARDSQRDLQRDTWGLIGLPKEAVLKELPNSDDFPRRHWTFFENYGSYRWYGVECQTSIEILFRSGKVALVRTIGFCPGDKPRVGEWIGEGGTLVSNPELPPKLFYLFCLLDGLSDGLSSKIRHSELEMSITVNPNGRVVTSSITKTSGDKNLDDQASTTVKALRFPHFPKGLSLKTFSLRFGASTLNHPVEKAIWKASIIQTASPM
jgi:TonB family protein